MSRAFATALLLLFGATSLVACKSNCRQLSEKLCDCSRNSLERDSCIRRASASESSYPPSPEADAVCGDLIDGCDCNLIDTPEGKRACGLAR